METGLISFLTFLLGLLLGNWLAIGRDKRKEFNEAAAPVRGWLLKSKADPSPYIPWPSDQEIDRFVHCLAPWRRARFMKRFSTCRELHNSELVSDEAGQVAYVDDTVILIRRELNELFAYTTPR
jgi:hypothetical protein